MSLDLAAKCCPDTRKYMDPGVSPGSKTRRKRCVVVINRMRVEKLASVESIVSRVPEPYEKTAFIQTLAHEFWIKSCSGRGRGSYSLTARSESHHTAGSRL